MNRVFLIISLLIPALSFAQAINKEDFAYGIDVEAEANTYYEVDVTKDLYAGIQSPDLYDLRVFGPDGNPVPYLIKRQKQKNNTAESYKTHDFFPVSSPVELTHSDNVRVIINRDGSMSVDVKATPISRSEIAAAVFYVIDLGEKPDRHIKSIQFQWNDRVVEQSKITISTSSDLNHWRHAGQGTLVSLFFGANKLRHDTIEIDKYDRYIKIASDKAVEFRLDGLKTSSSQNVEIKQKPIWMDIKGTSRANNEYYYIAPGHFPIDFLEITPAVENTATDVWMRSGTNGKEFHQTQFRGNIYSLKVGKDEVHSDTISLFGTTHRHWLLKVLDKDNTVAPMPSVKIGWYPHIIHFVSSKPGIYTVAYGSTGITHHGSLLPSVLIKGQYSPVHIKPGLPKMVGGVEPLAPPTDRSKYAKWALWGILSITLMVVGYMAFRLFRHMNVVD